jgi:hypothetical protein
MRLFPYWINSHSCFLGVNLCLKRGAEIAIKKSQYGWTEKSCEVPRHALGWVRNGFFKFGFDASQEFKIEVIAGFSPGRDIRYAT